MNVIVMFPYNAIRTRHEVCIKPYLRVVGMVETVNDKDYGGSRIGFLEIERLSENDKTKRYT